jgi:hypothetical protein
MVKGSTARAWWCTTACTSGRAEARVQDGFEIGLPMPRVLRHPFEVEADQVVTFHEFGALGAGQPEEPRIGRVARRDMAEIINHVLPRQDTVGDHEIAQQRFGRVGHVALLRGCLRT